MAAVTSAVVGVGTAVAGAVSASKTRKSNEKLAKRAEVNEKNRRERAAQELEKATDQYNKIRAERPGLTVQEFLTERVEGITGPEAQAAREAFDQLTEDDLRKAQAFANEAAIGNIDSFNTLVDAVSGGNSIEILEARNRNALETNAIDAFTRALQLRSTAIPAGTVRRDSEGRLIEGQAADKQVFQTAFEVEEEQRDKQFGKLNTILEADRRIAERQNEKARDFLNSRTSFGQFSQDLGTIAQGERLAFQKLDEATQLQVIRDFQSSAFSDQTRQPTFQSTAGAEAAISGGLDLAIRGLSQSRSEG